jgi:multidrug resistance efflux pump
MSIEKATKDQKLARLEAVAKKAELDIADLAIDKRVIKAPFNGMVEKVYRKQDEWVMHGDPIMYLFRLDTMNVEGAVEQANYDPHELQGCDVTVEVQLARGRKETVRGRITKVSSVVDLDGKYAVRAEVPNREEHGTWLLRDGMVASMTIHLGTGSGGGGVTRVPR